MPPKNNKNKKMTKRTNSKRYGKSKTGLNRVEKSQVRQIIKQRKEVYYVPAYQYCGDRVSSSGFLQGLLQSANCFGGNKISTVGLTVGNTPGSISNSVNASGTKLYPTGGIKLSDGSNTLYPSVPIQGNKALVKSMLCKIRISAIAVESVNQDVLAIKPMNFRCVVFKIKAGSRPAGLVPSLITGATSAPSMFKNTLNEDIGLDDYIAPYDYEQLRLNTESLEVLRDFQFKLMNPVSASSTSPGSDGYAIVNNQNLLPTTKDLSFWLPTPKRPITYDSDYKPENWDYRTFVMVFANRQGSYTGPGVYAQSTGFWNMEASITSRVQEF